MRNRLILVLLVQISFLKVLKKGRLMIPNYVESGLFVVFFIFFICAGTPFWISTYYCIRSRDMEGSLCAGFLSIVMTVGAFGSLWHSITEAQEAYQLSKCTVTDSVCTVSSAYGDTQVHTTAVYTALVNTYSPCTVFTCEETGDWKFNWSGKDAVHRGSKVKVRAYKLEGRLIYASASPI